MMSDAPFLAQLKMRAVEGDDGWYVEMTFPEGETARGKNPFRTKEEAEQVIVNLGKIGLH
jgi:hypothetical protein